MVLMSSLAGAAQGRGIKLAKSCVSCTEVFIMKVRLAQEMYFEDNELQEQE